MEKDADCRRPKNDVEEGKHHPEKKGLNPYKQGQKGAVFRFPIGCQHNLTRVGVTGEGGKAARTEGNPMYFSLLLARGQSVKRQCALQGPRRKSRSETRMVPLRRTDGKGHVIGCDRDAVMEGSAVAEMKPEPFGLGIDFPQFREVGDGGVLSNTAQSGEQLRNRA